MATMLNRSMAAVGDLGLVQPTDLSDDLVNETEEMRKKRLEMKKAPAGAATGIISPAVQALLGQGVFNGV